MCRHLLLSVIATVLFASTLMGQQLIKEGEYKPEDTEYYEPKVEKITPGQDNQPPSDATVLFDGQDLSAWEAVEGGGEVPWTVEDGYFTVKPESGDIQTKENFGDFQLHIEWRSPQEIVGEGQGRGNSGIFLQGLYEVQVLDSYESETYVNGQAGSIYKQTPPLVNATRTPDEWEVYDIIYTAPKFDEKNQAMVEPGYVTVLHNGIVVQHHTRLQGTTEYIGPPQWKAHGDGPIKLQDHSNPVSYRNIWIRPLD